MVKIMPYRTLSNVIDGVVITFNDITVSKNLEAELRQSQTKIVKIPKAKKANGQPPSP